VVEGYALIPKRIWELNPEDDVRPYGGDGN